MVNHYAILGVSETASTAEILAAHRRLAFAQHPDRCAPDRREDATRAFARINEARRVLSDPHARAAYDRERRDPGLRPRAEPRVGEAPIDQAITSLEKLAGMSADELVDAAADMVKDKAMDWLRRLRK